MKSELNSINEERGYNGSIVIATPDVPVEWPSTILLSKKGTHEGSRTKKVALTFDTAELVQWLRQTADELELAHYKQIKKFKGEEVMKNLFLKDLELYKEKLKEFGEFDLEEEEIFISSKQKGTWTNEGFFEMNFEIFGPLGLIELSIDSNKSFRIAKTSVPIFVNGFDSLRQLKKLFKDSPFCLNINKIEEVKFDRYSVELSVLEVNNFNELLTCMDQLRNIFKQVKRNPLFETQG
ncbi:TPA: hypothetical protein ACGY7S_002789 [Enterococcus faecalis]|uniref:hypothetical protein n=1 Tax=Enterococcus sp. C37 TaxID=3231298 RepID=UPI0026AC9ACF